MGSYLHASKDISARNEAHIRFWLYSEGEPLPLHEVLERHNSNVLPEYSTCILVEGDIVQVRLSGDTEAFRFSGHDASISLGASAHLDLEACAVPASDAWTAGNHSNEGALDTADDALILIEWNDSQRKAKRRLVMMLLRWVEPDRAERRGLLSEYRREWNADSLKQIPRRRKKFTLQ